MASDPSRVLVAGDTHMDIPHMEYLIKVALDNNCDTIHQVGDFCFFPHAAEGILFLAATAKMLNDANMVLSFNDGNHENFDALWGGEWPINEYGFWEVHKNIFYVPRGARWKWSDVSFMAMGGAFSVDADDRRRWEGRRSRTLWWPEETITEGDLMRATTVRQSVDILLTHDCPISIRVPGLRPFASDHASTANRKRLQVLMDCTQPKQLLHGHFHVPYQKRYESHLGYRTKVTGLGKNGMMDRSWAILDLEHLKDGT